MCFHTPHPIRLRHSHRLKLLFCRFFYHSVRTSYVAQSAGSREVLQTSRLAGSRQIPHKHWLYSQLFLRNSPRCLRANQGFLHIDPMQCNYCLHVARQVRIDVSHREPIQTNMTCAQISPFVCGNISTNSVAKISRYIPLSISQPEPRSSTEKVQLFIRFYYYSDSNIKVKSSEEPPSSQPCPFFLQKQVNGYFQT